jgi:Fur family peroxide stress response transcriptional regulator
MKKLLKDSGFKQTPQRLAILDFLQDNKTHPSVEDIYRSISRRFPTISLATVYNNLLTLKQLGMIRELTIDPDKKHYDPNISSHNHLICTECKQIIDININYKLNIPEESKCGFEITGNHIEFYGICPDCRKKRLSQG